MRASFIFGPLHYPDSRFRSAMAKKTGSSWTVDDLKENIPDRCECGAFKALGADRYQVGHSEWCPWHETRLP